MPIDLKELQLPALSEAGVQVLELLSSDDVDFGVFADFIAKDPLLSATMLKYANSPVYKRQVKISNVRNAISMLGFKTCKMAVSFALMKSYENPPTPVTEAIWSHSVNCSTIARIISGTIFPKLVDDIETSGLMHDMGSLVLAHTYTDQYQYVFEQALNGGTPLDQLEKEAFGASHDEIFHFIAKHLRISDTTVKVVESFHAGQAITAIADEVDKHRLVLYLSHYFLDRYNHVNTFSETLPNDMDSLMLLLNLNEDSIDGLYDECEMMLNVL